jgi:Domain of unknown function (DUF4157)
VSKEHAPSPAPLPQASERKALSAAQPCHEPVPAPILDWTYGDLPLIQRKLSIGSTDDPLEHEADATAERVMRMPDPEKCGCHKDEEETHEKVSRKAIARSSVRSEAPPIVHDAIREPGQPLGSSARAFFEPRFGFDFSKVRIHTGSQAAQAAHRINAAAFTVGRHIVFGLDRFAPGTESGSRLLAHELAHIVQQTSSRALVQRDLARPVPAPEAVASALTPDQIQAAIRFNTVRFDDPYVFAVIRDVLGISRFPAIVDEEFIRAIVRWQAENNLPQDGRLNARTTATIVAELRAEARLVPALANDATRVELEAALTFNGRLNLDARTITIFQALVAAPTTGRWDDATIQRIMVWQGVHHIVVDGMVGPDTLRTLIEELIASTLFDDAIHVVVNAFHFPTANLAAIQFDATVTGADAVTTGVIGTGQPQTVRVGPSTFTADYPHMIRIIGHELQHVQQRSGAAPIANQHVREFLSFAWEALSTDSPALTAADRVTHANIAINHWNQAPAADRTPFQDTRDRLDRLIAAGGVGNF